MKFHTIKNKFVVLFMLLVTVTIILIGIASDYIIQKYITTNVIKTFQDDLKSELIKVDSFLRGIKTDIDILADNTAQNLVKAIDSGDVNEIAKWKTHLGSKFHKYLDVKRIYTDIVFIDKSGSGLLSASSYSDDSITSSKKLSNFEHLIFMEAIKLGRNTHYISPFRLKKTKKEAKVPFESIITFARPVFNSDNEKAGIILMNVSGDSILKILKHSNAGNLTLVNRDGYFLLHPNENLEFRFDTNSRPGERLQKYYPNHAGKILTGDSGVVDTGRGWVTTWLYWFHNPGDELLVFRKFTPSQSSGNYWVLIKSGFKKELIGTLMTMRGIMLGISSIFFAITFPVILYFGFRLTNSISKLKKAMEGFEHGEGMEVLDINKNDEFSELTQSFVTMSESLYCTKMNLNAEFQRLKNLIEFSRLVGEEIYEKECYAILVNFLSKSFYFDKVITISFNNSENIAEVLTVFEGTDGQLRQSGTGNLDLKVTHDTRLCRASRSGHKFIVGDVETDYKCRYQEFDQECGSYGCFPVTTGGAVLGWIHLANFNKGYFTDERCFMIESYINTIAPAINSIRLLNAHRKMSVQDPLTGLYNRRFLEEIMERQIAISDRYRQPVSTIMLDIDHFKKFNDTYGHAFGDKALILVSRIISMSVRDSDTVARFGGEEFIVVLPNTEIEDACHLAEKLRRAVQDCSITNDNGISEGVTISLGVSTYPRVAHSMNDLIASADSALYQSKARGRNMITRAEPSTAPADNSN